MKLTRDGVCSLRIRDVTADDAGISLSLSLSLSVHVCVPVRLRLLWSALCNRADHYIFALFSFILSFIFLA